MAFYIDPGTGSMLFTILVGLLGAGAYAARNLWVKLDFILTGGKTQKITSQRLPYVIFSDDKRYWNVFEPICREFEKRKIPVTYLTSSPDDPALQKEFQYVTCEFIGEGNQAFARLNILNADIVLATTPGLQVYQWKRSKTVCWYAHVLHAANDPCTYRMYGLDAYDAVLISGEYQKEQLRTLEQLRQLPPKELPMIGQPYMDEMLRKLREAPELPEHPVTVLLAPSWGECGLLSKYGSNLIDALLKTGYHIVVRPHPQTCKTEREILDRLMKSYPETSSLEWNFDTNNFEILRRSDIMISDFSGVMLDFTLVFDKPLIYTESEYDPAPYDSWYLKEKPWIFRALPELGMELTPEKLPHLKEIIDCCIQEPTYQSARHRLRDETWCNIGRSAAMTADYLIQKHDELI